MTDVVVIGGGPTGLTAAMKFASTGASVVVLERDAGPMPDDAEEAWTTWERRAVTQFRQVHFLQSGGCRALEAHCPAVVDNLRDLGAVTLHADTVFSAPRPAAEPDPQYATLTTARRPVLELAFARAAVATSGVEIRRGAVVSELLTGPEVISGVPHIVGVRLADGSELTADLVVDAGGRRSAVGSMIEAVGGVRPAEHSTDVGFVYTSRFYRGELPEYREGMLTALGSISALTVHGDNDTWATTLYTHPDDKAFRRLRDPDVFERVVRTLPDHAHWVDGDAIGDPESMVSTANTIRDFVVDGRPVATGIIPLGDAYAFTNPSVGRGIAIGIIHAIDVAESVTGLLDDPVAVAAAWQAGTERRARDFVDTTIAYDQVRGPEVAAAVRGEVHEHTDAAARMSVALDAARHRDQEVYEHWRDVASLQATLSEVLGRDGLFARVLEHGAEPWVANQPTREQLLAAVG